MWETDLFQKVSVHSPYISKYGTRSQETRAWRCPPKHRYQYARWLFILYYWVLLHLKNNFQNHDP